MKSLKNLFMFLIVFVLTFLAACSKPVYTVTFDTACDATVAAQEVKENEQATKPADPTREGYDLAGWYLGEEKYDFSTPVVGNITLVAKWNQKEYTVTFVTNCDTTVTAQTVKHGESATQPAALTKDGYKFDAWYNGEAKYDFTEKVTSNITLTAQWKELNYYTINFIVDGEIVYTESVQEGKSATAPAAPTKEGYEFSAWDGQYQNVTANADVVALYTVNMYTVQFVLQGENYGDPFLVEYGAACETPDDPSVEGYTFTGWDVDFSNVKQNLTVTAKMEAIEYTIKYYSGTTEITTFATNKYTIEDSIDLEEYKIENYDFYGWYEAANLQGEPVYQIYQGTTGNKEYYALNVAVVANGGVEECWSAEFPTSHDAGKGIDEISDLPEIFERDFFNYLSANNLLGAEGIFEGGAVTTWEEFSAVNPHHDGDPKRIWNDTGGSKPAIGQTAGYVGKFLYETLELKEDGTVLDVQGGFLGTEPYKTKYNGLLNLLLILYKNKTTYNSVTANTDTTRNGFAFIIDGYFYGTQGKGSGTFAAARSVLPGINFSYKIVGEEIVKIGVQGAPALVKEGYVLEGWYLDAEFTQEFDPTNATNLCTIYAKWVALQ